MSIKNKESLLYEIGVLEKEHKELDEFIDKNPDNIDELSCQRIKKRRLILKDKIKYLKSFIYPDILA